jgi:predicted transcriptional regulator
MTNRRSKRPTDAELEILGILWGEGPSTVREVHAILEKQRPTGYTTALKTMQIMAEKGLVERDESQRTHIYSAKLEREQAQRSFVNNMVDTVFGGSPKSLVMRALESEDVTAEDIAEIRKVIEDYGSNGR